MKYTFPTRNEARAILKAIDSQNQGSSLNYFTKKAILIYKDNGIDRTTFIFTNALTDMFSNANVNNENTIDSELQFGFNLQTASDFFKSEIGLSFEEILNQYEKQNSEYIVKLNPDDNIGLDLTWFNNSDKFIHPLLSAYQTFKQNKGLQFLKDDINQIPIDYSIVLCCNHYRQKGFITNKIVSLIIEKLVNAANNCLNTFRIENGSVEYSVLKDLMSPSAVRVAYDFIKQF
jgi:hypothetical protein